MLGQWFPSRVAKIGNRIPHWLVAILEGRGSIGTFLAVLHGRVSGTQHRHQTDCACVFAIGKFERTHRSGPTWAS